MMESLAFNVLNLLTFLMLIKKNALPVIMIKFMPKIHILVNKEKKSKFHKTLIDF